MKKLNMNAKKTLVSFMAIAFVLCLVATVSAADLANINSVEVNGLNAMTNNVAVLAGDTITVKVDFTSSVNASDITVEAEIEGDKQDVQAESVPFDIEDGKMYRKALALQVPFDLKEDLSGDATLTIKISGDGYRTATDYSIRVQRQAYNADIKSVSVSNTVEAGETIPVDVVLKNLGYNDLDDVYVTASISALGVEKTSYFGDIVALELKEDDENTATGRLLLKIPYNAESGVYALDIEVSNDDTVTSVTKQITINNDLSDVVIAANTKQSAAAGEDAEYSLIVVNPTDKLRVYKIVTESSGDVSSSTDSTMVAVAAGSSKTVTITANAVSDGNYNFDVSIFSGDELVDTVALELDANGSSVSNPVIVLTVILAIVFLVLLVVLIVLITKKPAKSEEFGESYY